MKFLSKRDTIPEEEQSRTRKRIMCFLCLLKEGMKLRTWVDGKWRLKANGPTLLEMEGSYILFPFHEDPVSLEINSPFSL